jgi:hypothetical protein
VGYPVLALDPMAAVLPLAPRLGSSVESGSRSPSGPVMEFQSESASLDTERM